MSRGIRVRLRRSSASEFEVRTDLFKLLEVVRGPPVKIYLRRLPQAPKSDRKQVPVKPEHVAFEEEPAHASETDQVEPMGSEPELVPAQYQSSEDEKIEPSEDRLTSRQRSLKMAQEAEEEDEDEEEEDEPDEEEDLGPMSKEEAALRKSEMRRRRRLALDKIEEQAKQETIERLLKKTSVRMTKSDKKRQRNGDDNRKSATERRLEELKIAHPDVIRYRSFVHGDQYLATLTLPDGYSLEFGPHLSRPQKKARCDCGQPRLYSCAKTSKPLCSLTCYQKLHMKAE